LLRAALQETKGHGGAIEFIVANTGYYKVIRVDFHEGERYPQLERVQGTRDFLDDILAPMAGAKGTAK
jgi:hypothetical protein